VRTIVGATVLLQTKLAINNQRVWAVTQQRSKPLFENVTGPTDDAGFATACEPILSDCLHSDLNPFSRGVNTTLSYGSYLTVEPTALQSYYSETFLSRLKRCVLQPLTCADSQTPPSLQVRSPFSLRACV
jgi:hypothetical protein